MCVFLFITEGQVSVSLLTQTGEILCNDIILTEIKLAELASRVSLWPTATHWFCLIMDRTTDL